MSNRAILGHAAALRLVPAPLPESTVPADGVLCDALLECRAAGLLLLGRALPAWVESHHFACLFYRQVFNAARELGEVANLPSIAALLRSQGRLYTRDMGPDRHSRPYFLSSVDLYEIMCEADSALLTGARIELERLRELSNRRELLETLRRVEVQLLAGDFTHREARAELAEHFNGVLKLEREADELRKGLR